MSQKERAKRGSQRKHHFAEVTGLMSPATLTADSEDIEGFSGVAKDGLITTVSLAFDHGSVGDGTVDTTTAVTPQAKEANRKSFASLAGSNTVAIDLDDEEDENEDEDNDDAYDGNCSLGLLANDDANDAASGIELVTSCEIDVNAVDAVEDGNELESEVNEEDLVIEQEEWSFSASLD